MYVPLCMVSHAPEIVESGLSRAETSVTRRTLILKHVGPLTKADRIRNLEE